MADQKALFEREACDLRLRQVLAAKFCAVTKVSGLVTLLLEDDRIACEYACVDKSGNPMGYKLLTGGYFRFYNPTEDMIYLSPFTRPIQFGLSDFASEKKLDYLKWHVPRINHLYIKKSTEMRIQKNLMGQAARDEDSQSEEVNVNKRSLTDTMQFNVISATN